MVEIGIENYPSMKKLLRLHNVSNSNMPESFPYGTYIDVISGDVTTLRIPNGVVNCFCENLDIKEIICPQSLKELYCKNNKIQKLHIPEFLCALDCSHNNIIFLKLLINFNI